MLDTKSASTKVSSIVELDEKNQMISKSLGRGHEVSLKKW